MPYGEALERATLDYPRLRDQSQACTK